MRTPALPLAGRAPAPGTRSDDHDAIEFRTPIERIVRDAVTGGADAATALALECFEAFVEQECDPAAAARDVAVLCVQFGESRAVHGLSDDQLTAAVRAIGRDLRRHVIPSAVRELGLPDVEELSRSVQEYLLRVVAHVRHGMQSVQRFNALPAERRRGALAAALFGSADRRMVRALAIACDVDPHASMTPVVVVCRGVSLDDALRSHPEVITGPTTAEALVPAAWSSAQVAHLSGTAIARGPSVELLSAPDAVRLTRTTASVATADTPVTESRDVLARLVVASCPLLGNLLVEERLAPLDSLPLARRATLGRTLLSWLELGRPINEVARRIDVPSQTVHTRLASARRLLGDTLCDPDGRLELLAALRTALPRWEAELDGR